LMRAADDVVEIVVTQGEKRLEGQCAFAEVQDARGGALVQAAVALAAAAAGVCAGAAGLKGIESPLAWAAGMATLGFSVASLLALWASRACNFHSPGWYPNDFADDLVNSRCVRSIRADIALDLQIRLSQNFTALNRRGGLYNAATIALLATPIVALVAGLLAA
jgi:hypothetical protein